MGFTSQNIDTEHWILVNIVHVTARIWRQVSGADSVHAVFLTPWRASSNSVLTHYVKYFFHVSFMPLSFAKLSSVFRMNDPFNWYNKLEVMVKRKIRGCVGLLGERVVNLIHFVIKGFVSQGFVSTMQKARNSKFGFVEVLRMKL